MRKLLGKYHQISTEDLIKYSNLDPRFIVTLENIYYQNEELVPLDLIAYYSGVMSYDNFSKNYARAGHDLVLGRLDKIANPDVVNSRLYSENIKNQFLRYNLIPYHYDEFNLYFLTINQAYPDNQPELNLYIPTVAEVLGCLQKSVVIHKTTNKLFADVLYMLLNEPQYSEQDIELLHKHRWDLIFTDAVVEEASEVYVDKSKDGISIDFSIYNDRINYKKFIMSRVECDNFLQTLYSEAGLSYDDASFKVKPHRDFKVKDLAKQCGKYYGRAQMVLTDQGIKPVIRVADAEKSAIPLPKLNISGNIKSQLAEYANIKSGLILLSGATGSGKTTLIYSLLDHLKTIRSRDRIEEISKPVEARIDGISQISIDIDQPLTLEMMVEAETRRNAQIITLGEVNSFEVLRGACDLALQSKLIISTVHSDSIAMMFDRIKGMAHNSMETYLQFLELAKVLMHQTMVKEACPLCKKQILVETLRQEQKDVLTAFNYSRQSIYLSGEDKYCEPCQGRGFLIKKPVVIASLLYLNEDLKDKLRDMTKGMRPFLEHEIYKMQAHECFDAMRYLEEGIITLDSVWYELGMDNIRPSILNKHKKMD